MSLSLEPAEPQADLEPVQPRRRRLSRGITALTVIAALLVIGVFVAWLARGLQAAAPAIKVPATQAGADLTNMKTFLQNGDQASARKSLAAAHAQLATAESAASRPQVVIARFLPVLSQPVGDLRHLLAAAKAVVNAGDQVVALYDDISGKDSKLFHDSGFDLVALKHTNDSVTKLMKQLDSAQRNLKKVRGGRFAPGAKEARDSALAQIATLRKDAAPLVSILGVLPKALGEDRQTCYLVTLQNQAELRPGGGAPLSLTSMCFNKGAMTILPTTSTLDSNQNAKIQWDAVPGNGAWHPPGKALPFASANFAPDWPTSGEELLRAYEAMTGTRAEGVIGIDVAAMAAVLKSTGATISTSGFGEVNADNLSTVLLIDAYKKYTFDVRHKNNEELMGLMVGKLISGGQLTSKFRALAATSPGHHMQMYFRDPTLQSLVDPTPMAGHLTPGTGDFVAVYTTNTNASKVDVFQSRTVEQAVVFGADGSAQVTRSITIKNDSPGYSGKVYARDRGNGYETTFSIPIIATYVPPGARVTRFEAFGSSKATIYERPFATDKGMHVLQLAANLPRTHFVTATVGYTTKAAPVQGYRLRIASQATYNATQITVSVVPPPGYHALPTDGWEHTANRWTKTLSVTSDVDILLPFARG